MRSAADRRADDRAGACVTVPAWLGDVELSGSAMAVPDAGQRSAVLLVRAFGRPLGTLVLGPGAHSAESVRARAAEVFPAPPPVPAPLPSTTPTISVVVPTRPRDGRVGMLLRCLVSLARQDRPAAEIVVVENGTARPMLPDLLAGEPDLVGVPVRLLHRAGAGSAAARNTGVQASSGTVIATTDDDAVADRGWLAALAVAVERDGGVAAVTGLTQPLALRTEAQLWFERYYGGFAKGFRQQEFRLGGGPADDPFFPYLPGRMGSGNNLAVRRDVLLSVGGYDPAFGPGSVLGNGEDIDLLYRLLVAGHTVRYDPSALVRHEHRADPAAFREQIRGYGRGFTGFLTKTVLDRPAVVIDMARRVPAVVAAVARGRTAVTQRPSSAGYPRSTRWHETRGMVGGPPRYLASRRAVRRGDASVDGLTEPC